jgi:hypothetical protein
MPGLRLTVKQVQRLCGVEPTICHAALEALVEARFLQAKSDGTYARLTDQSAYADLVPPRKASWGSSMQASVTAANGVPQRSAR